MLSSQSIKTLEALYNEIAKMKENLSYKDMSLDEKATHIASLKSENSNIEEKNSELNNKLTNSMQLLEDLKVKNNKLISQISTLKDQYDPDVMTHKELQLKLAKYNQRLGGYESDISDYKQQISDQQKIINACECEEKSIKIDLLVAENTALETRLDELSELLGQQETSEDTTLLQMDSLLLKTDSIHEEPIKKREVDSEEEEDADEEENTYNSCKELQSKVIQLEDENQKLEIAVDSYKTQVIDQQFIIDEYDCFSSLEERERKKMEGPEATEHENYSLRKLNLELQSQLAQFKEEATRLKLNYEKCKDELFAKKVELESITSKNAQYKKDSLILHSPCNEKIHTLEYQLDGLREINLQLSNKFNQLKEKYDQVKFKQKQDYNEMIRLTNEFSEEQQQMKIRDDDIKKLNGMKSECAKLIFILKRIKKDHHRIRAMLKSSEKETSLAKLENEKLDLENRRLKADVEDIAKDKSKVENTNQQLKATLSEMKKANNARAKDYKILSDRLKKSESKLKVFIRPFL